VLEFHGERSIAVLAIRVVARRNVERNVTLARIGEAFLVSRLIANGTHAGKRKRSAPMIQERIRRVNTKLASISEYMAKRGHVCSTRARFMALRI